MRSIGGVHLPVGICRWWFPRGLWTGFLMESTVQSAGSMSLQCPPRILTTTFPILSLPTVIENLSCRKKMSLFGKNLHSWGSQVLTHLLSFSPLLEKSQGKKVLLSSKLWCLGGGVIHARSSCFSYLLQTHTFFPSVECWNFYSGNLDFYKGSLVCGDCPSQCSLLPVQWPRGARTSSQATAGATAMEVSLPITWYTGGWDSSRAIWRMVPQLPQKHFC